MNIDEMLSSEAPKKSKGAGPKRVFALTCQCTEDEHALMRSFSKQSGHTRSNLIVAALRAPGGLFEKIRETLKPLPQSDDIVL